MYAEKKLKGTKKRTIIGEITSPNFKTQEATEIKTVWQYQTYTNTELAGLDITTDPFEQLKQEIITVPNAGKDAGQLHLLCIV